MSKIKLNWGTGIAIFYISFVVAILGFVFWTTQYKPDLVTENYYEEEMSYQDKIDGRERLNNLNENVKIVSNNGNTEIILPQKLRNKNIVGNLHLYRSSDASLDQKFTFSGEENVYFFDSGQLKKGHWEAKLFWTAEGKEYYYEETFRIK